MSTQEQAVPKRRSSRSAAATRRASGQRRAEGTASAVASGAATPVTPTANAVKAAPDRKSGAGDTGGGTRKERSQKDASPRKGLVNTERFDGIRRFTRDTYAEIKKVNWPDQQATRNLTVVVIAVSASLGILLGGMDFILLKIFEALP